MKERVKAYFSNGALEGFSQVYKNLKRVKRFPIYGCKDNLGVKAVLYDLWGSDAAENRLKRWTMQTTFLADFCLLLVSPLNILVYSIAFVYYALKTFVSVPMMLIMVGSLGPKDALSLFISSADSFVNSLVQLAHQAFFSFMMMGKGAVSLAYIGKIKEKNLYKPTTQENEPSDEMADEVTVLEKEALNKRLGVAQQDKALGTEIAKGKLQPFQEIVSRQEESPEVAGLPEEIPGL